MSTKTSGPAASRRSTIATNPLDSYDPLGHIPSAAEIEEREAKRVPKSAAPKPVVSNPAAPKSAVSKPAALTPPAVDVAPAESASADVPLRQLSARVPADLVQRLKIAVATVGVSQQDALVEAVEMWIGAKAGKTS